MKQPRISIIVAVYNTSKYLKKCLDKITHQSLQNDEYEVIVVNDCSTDNSANIVREYMKLYSNIKFIDKEKNEATFWSRIDGMYMARGQYIGFVDSDDWIDENMYLSMVQVAEEKGVDIVECGYEDDLATHYQLNEGAYTINQIVDLFVERKINASLWMRIYSNRIVKNVLNSTIKHLIKEDFLGIRNEDEFLFPLLLNEAKSYYAVHITPYHYRLDTEGSVMSEIKRDIEKKIFHANTIILAGDLLLKETLDYKKTYAKFLFLQTNNLFYLMGIAKCNNIDIRKFKDKYKKHFLVDCKMQIFINKNIKLTLKLFFRNLHLFIRYLQLCKIGE